MSWCADPDTLSIAAAQGAVKRLGIELDTVEWMIAYRAAYDPVDGLEDNEYLQSLDEQIEIAQNGGDGPSSDSFVLGISVSQRENARRVFGTKGL